MFKVNDNTIYNNDININKFKEKIVNILIHDFE